MAEVETENCEPLEGLERGGFVRLAAPSAGGQHRETGPSSPRNGVSDGRTVDAHLVDSGTAPERKPGRLVRDLP